MCRPLTLDAIPHVQASENVQHAQDNSKRVVKVTICNTQSATRLFAAYCPYLAQAGGYGMQQSGASGYGQQAQGGFGGGAGAYGQQGGYGRQAGRGGTAGATNRYRPY